jgi:hypothetical protein
MNNNSGSGPKKKPEPERRPDPRAITRFASSGG